MLCGQQTADQAGSLHNMHVGFGLTHWHSFCADRVFETAMQPAHGIGEPDGYGCWWAVKLKTDWSQSVITITLQSTKQQVCTSRKLAPEWCESASQQLPSKGGPYVCSDLHLLLSARIICRSPSVASLQDQLPSMTNLHCIIPVKQLGSRAQHGDADDCHTCEFVKASMMLTSWVNIQHNPGKDIMLLCVQASPSHTFYTQPSYDIIAMIGTSDQAEACAILLLLLLQLAPVSGP